MSIKVLEHFVHSRHFAFQFFCRLDKLRNDFSFCRQKHNRNRIRKIVAFIEPETPGLLTSQIIKPNRLLCSL